MEVAPGIDLQRDILDQMKFQPLMRSIAVMKI
jgi:acyl CoA:acetate/3-ketoacid CoA transferase